MSDDFQGRDPIILQPGDSSVPFSFTFAASTAATANTGSIPYGTELATVATKIFNEAGASVTTDILVSESNTTSVETILLKYPSSSSPGRFSIEMSVTLDSSAVIEFDFTRVYALDKEAKR